MSPELSCLADADAASRPLISVRPAGLDAALAALDPAQARFARASGFTAAPQQLTLLPGADGVAAALLGLGEDRSCFAHGGLANTLPEDTAWTLVPGDFDQEAATLGFCLGAYHYGQYRKPKRLPARLAGAEGQHQALLLARAAWFARDLVNAPANLLGPAELADATQGLGQRFGANVQIVSGAQLAAAYPAIAAVGQGSARQPHVAKLAWQGSRAGADAPLVILCGKGVCFDTGGYDLKPPAAMLRMKKDMGGAAMLLGLAQALMEADTPIRLGVRIGCVENMVSGAAMRPMDVLQTRRGLTVEVGNTDAEGRLVLCDLLAEASDEQPALLLDAATLTGAARVALGPDLPGLFTPQDWLAAELSEAGTTAHDPVWRLPLWPGYDSWLSSTTADLGNVSPKPFAGAIVAGLFLQRFVDAAVPWAHLDCYSWNDQTRPGRPEGGESMGMRALFGYVRKLSSERS